MGLASPGLPGPLPEVAQPPRFSWLRRWVWEGRTPIPPIPFHPIPGVSSPCQQRSPGAGPSAAGFPAPRQECAGGFRPPARRGRFLFRRYLSGSRRVPPGRAMERMEVTETFAGIALPGHLHTQESLSFAAAFTFRPTDVLIATYPKSGEGLRGRGDNEGTR